MPHIHHCGVRLRSTKPNAAGMKAPTANPRTNCTAMSKSMSWRNGGSSEVTVKTAPVHSSTRRVLSTVLIHAAAGVTTICATPNAVPIHEASSKPRLMAPRMSARPKVVNLVLSDEMNAPSITARMPRTGRSQRPIAGSPTAGRAACA